MLERLSTQFFSPQLRSDITEGTNQLNSNGTDNVNKVPQTQNEAEAGQSTGQEKNSQQGISKKKIQDVVEGLNQFLQPAHTSLHFKYHEKLNDYYVQVVNQETNETIREIPSKKLLDVYASMLEFVGLMVDEKI